ncbi:MAG TPA: hypothetical protein VIG08_11430 [Gemmatimonadales bacterium]
MHAPHVVRLAQLAGPIIYSLALAGVAAAFVSPPPSRHQPSRAPRAVVGACNGLSVGKQVKAVKVFAEMLPVFRHARCMNCHGGLDPTSDQHPGKDQLDPELTLFANREAFLAQCQECHDGLPGWMVPPTAALFFTGKSDEDICRQMKQFEHSGPDFVEHIENDHHGIQFIAAGFAGDRALGEGLRDYGLVVEKPPGTQAEMTQKAQKWVDALEGHYADSPECGCVVPKMKLKLKHTTMDSLPNGLPSNVASEVEFEVNLLPMGDEKPGGYQGELTLTRNIRLTVPQDCSASGSRRERWQFYALFPPGSDSITVWRFLFDEDPEGGIQCRHGTGTMRITHLSPGTPTSMLGTAEPFLMPSDSGSTKRFELAEGGERETLSITVVERPDGE